MTYEFDFSSVFAYWQFFLEGARTTVVMSFWSTLAGFILGVMCAVARSSSISWLSKTVGAYVEVIRNTPLIIQSYFLIFGMSSVGLTMPILVGAILALVINITAYTCEIVRAGIESVPRSQREAGECLGLSPLQVYWHIILVPALERVYPALTSQFILLMLVTSVLSAVGTEDLFGVSGQVQSMTFRNFEVFIILWGIYLAMSLMVRAIFWMLAKLLFVRRRRLGTLL
ncbi:amino acid ABC transporter membrane protein 1 (PAAT family) [Advenella incenata]|jgi:polar amino acid transport system permease protein|uniref:Amino acid ABC transporter membrane protein 1 (PAAT family) n=1 Tax=Advenella incenata TaxID=267800 RepID=A0A4Q7VV60_9BURK|nr:amino acid ABC transporter permease [Advenella incenata]RZU00473.1 amino acid ABC transporter membrane protein 1 (PAAT family) [Advenella incenata]